MGMFAQNPKGELHTGQETPTQQQFLKDADINNIVARAKKTGVLGTGVAGNRKPMFGDFSSYDFMAIQNKIADIEGLFMDLPPKLRSRFKNDPYNVVRFVEDPENHEQAVKWGLIPKPPEKAPEPPQEAVKADPEANPVPVKKGAKAPRPDGD